MNEFQIPHIINFFHGGYDLFLMFLHGGRIHTTIDQAQN